MNKSETLEDYANELFEETQVLKKQLQQYKSIVKAVDPDNLPEGEVAIVLDNRMESGFFDSKYSPVHFTEKNNFFDLEFVNLESYPINYIETKDIIKLLK